MRTLALLLCAMTIVGVGLPAERECEAQDIALGGEYGAGVRCCAPQAAGVSCPYERACVSGACPSGEPCGNAVTRFLAFGCRLNYRLTNWILSDKCQVGGMMTPYPCGGSNFKICPSAVDKAAESSL